MGGEGRGRGQLLKNANLIGNIVGNFRKRAEVFRQSFHNVFTLESTLTDSPLYFSQRIKQKSDANRTIFDGLLSKSTEKLACIIYKWRYREIFNVRCQLF